MSIVVIDKSRFAEGSLSKKNKYYRIAYSYARNDWCRYERSCSGEGAYRFHLLHSCASMMLISGVAMKQIQERLGHSDFSTTANIYAHPDYNSKLSSAEAMLAGLGLKGSEA